MRASGRESQVCEESTRSPWRCDPFLRHWRARRATVLRSRKAGEMVWHLFKKDWKLAWVFVLVVSGVHWIDSAIIYKLGLFDEDPMLGMLADAVPMLAFFASMFLIGAIVHLDSIPGVRQDWLVRPISRLDLVVEKLLFIVLMV